MVYIWNKFFHTAQPSSVQSSGTSDEGMERNWIILTLYPSLYVLGRSHVSSLVNTHRFSVLKRSFSLVSFLVYTLYSSVFCPEKIIPSCFISGSLVPIALVYSKDHSIIFHLWFTLYTLPFFVPKRTRSTSMCLTNCNFYCRILRTLFPSFSFCCIRPIRRLQVLRWNSAE